MCDDLSQKPELPPLDDLISTTPVIPPQECWRCGKSNPGAISSCTYCAAPFSAPRRNTAQRRPSPASPTLSRLLLIYAASLALSVLVALGVRGWQHASPEQAQNPALLLGILFLEEMIFAVLILITRVWLGPPPPLRDPPSQSPVLTWIIAAPLLLVVLGANLLYHYFLQTALNTPVVLYWDQFIGNVWLMIGYGVAVCVVAALYEEVFFRYILFDTLRQELSLPVTLVLTSMMFGLAHIHVPLSIPYLILAGLFLGWARIASGGLLLPIVLHCLHNFGVAVIECLSLP